MLEWLLFYALFMGPSRMTARVASSSPALPYWRSRRSAKGPVGSMVSGRERDSSKVTPSLASTSVCPFWRESLAIRSPEDPSSIPGGRPGAPMRRRVFRLSR